jgi:hypothetical protein
VMWCARLVKLIDGACFANSAIRRRPVDMVLELGVSAMFPSYGSLTWLSLPSIGSS